MERVSVATDGTEANGSSAWPHLSADGLVVAFASEASNLIAGDTNDAYDIFVHDRVSGTTTRVSIATGGAEANGDSIFNAISANGRYVAFTSQAGLAGKDTDNDGRCDSGCDDNLYQDVYRYDRTSKSFVLVSVGADDKPGDFHSSFKDMTPDGRLVVFSSDAANLVPGDTNNAKDVFVRDLVANTTTLVSRALTGGPGNGDSGGAAISADGRYIVFTSRASNLVANDTNDTWDVFVFDRLANEVSRVSVASSGVEADDMSSFPDISADGRFIVFRSTATNLVPLDPLFFNRSQVYLHDRLTGLTVRMSESASGVQASNAGQYPPAISGDGQVVVFDTPADNLLAGDTNQVTDIFVATNSRIDLVQAVINRVRPSDGGPGYALVAGKDLAVRVFASLPPGASPLQVQGVLCVDQPLDACPAANRFTASGTLYPGGHVFTDDARRQAENSVNFFITGQAADILLTPGSHTFAVRIDTPAGDLPAPISGQVAGDFRKSQPVEVFVYPIQLTDKNNNRVLPDATLLSRAAAFIRAAYPVDEAKVASHIQAAVPFAGLPIVQTGNATQDAKRLEKAQLQLIHTVARRLLFDQILLAAPDTPLSNIFGAGVTANLINGSNSIGTPGESGLLGYTYPAIKGVVVSLDRSPHPAPKNQPLLGSTVGHEMGHQFGFGDEYCYENYPCRVDNTVYKAVNPPPQSKVEGAETGGYVLEPMGAFDVTGFVRGRKAIFGPPGVPVFGYMGGGDDTNSWTTQIEYEYLYPRLTTPNPPAAEPRTIVAITGVLGADDSLTLDPPIVTTSPVPLRPAPASSAYSLDFLDGGGGIIASRPLDIPFVVEYLGGNNAGPKPVDTVPLAVIAELPAGTAAIAISHNGHVLGQVVRSAQPPQVRIDWVRVSGSAVTIGWSAFDPDGDPLTFAVLFAADGTDKRALGYDLTATSFTFDRRELAAAGPDNVIEVMASDGFHTASDRQKLVVAGGDLDGDGAVGLADAVLGLRFLAGLPTPSAGLFLPLADVNGNGVVDLAEVVYALNHAAFAGRLTAVLNGSPLAGGTVELMVRNAVPGPLTVKSLDPSVATVSGTASPFTVRGVAPGATSISVTDRSGTTVLVPVAVTGD